MKKYAPAVIFGIIEILIVNSILNNAQYTNYQPVMAALALIYATIRTLGITLGMVIDKLWLGLVNDIIEIKERIREDFDTQDQKENLKEITKKTEDGHVKMLIRSVGIFIIYVMALMSLLNN